MPPRIPITPSGNPLWSILPSDLTAADLREIRREAKVQLAAKENRCRPLEEPQPDRFRARGWHYITLPGERLSWLHEKSDMVEKASSLSRTPLLPTRASYVYYPRGGYIGMHRDQLACRITVLLPLSEEIEPLIIHPQLVDESSDQLLEISRREKGFPSGGRLLMFEEGGFVAINGSALPHHRAPTARPCLLGVFCFDSIW